MQAAEAGAVEPHTTAEHRHQLRIEPAPMREFCAYNENCLRPWLAAQIGDSVLPGQADHAARSVSARDALCLSTRIARDAALDPTRVASSRSS